MMRDTFLTPQQVAERLACSTKTVYAFAADGRLASVKVGTLVRIRESDLEEFVAQHLRGVTR